MDDCAKIDLIPILGESAIFERVAAKFSDGEDAHFDRVVRAEIEGRLSTINRRRRTETRPARFPKETR